jgi:hypothetical protein
MKNNEEFFKKVNSDAKKINDYKTKLLEYRFNSKEYDLNIFDENILNIKDIYMFPSEYEEEFNSYGYRSDNFLEKSEKHNGAHVLFSGCSQTIGFALDKRELWSKILYDKINKDKKCSGYFNLAISGSGIQIIISNLFKYFKNFGNPDYIFLNLPDPFRFIGFSPESDSYKKITFNTKDSEIQKFLCLINYHYYLMLEQYCNNNNIKLYSVSWHMDEPKYYNTNSFFSIFKTFIEIDYQKMQKDIINDEKKYSPEYYYYARDGVHDGIGYNAWLANFLYNEYLKNNI